VSTLTVLIVSLTVIGAAVAAVLITIAVSSVVEAHRVRLEPHLADARLAVVAAFSGEEFKTETALAHLSPFSERYIVGMMLELAPSVAGSSKQILVSLGEEIGMLQQAEAGIHAWRWSKRLYAARVLTAFGVESEERYGLFSDRSPELRAQAAAWCVAVPSQRGIEHLIELLADRDGQCRFAAKDALIRSGRPATELLLTALRTSSDVEVSDRILEVAAATGDQRFFGEASALATHPSPTTRALAMSVLASTGNAGAGEILTASLNDTSEQVITAAATGLARLSYWPAATAVEPLLSHPSWDVRRQAALTLLALDAPGTILLRADAAGIGPAAEMATRALELQSISLPEAAA
jgi:hypothetical protein